MDTTKIEFRSLAIRLSIISIFFCCTFLLHSCEPDVPPPSPSYVDPAAADQIEGSLALKWADMTLYTLRFSAFNTPTYSSRSLAYMGLAQYESIVPGSSINQSLQGQLEGLVLPTIAPNVKYNWVLSFNSAQRVLLKLLYPVPDNSHRFIHARIDSLADAMAQEQLILTNPETANRSIAFGESIALALFEWSLTDGGHQAYKRNFDPTFFFPTGDSYWVSPARGQTVSLFPLHPYWGENRRFVPANNNAAIPAIEPFSTDPSSNYYKLYSSVYQKNSELTLPEREVAAWWSDDPTETFSPPGHSYHLAQLVAQAKNSTLMVTAEAFARTGLAVADAFINCWQIKYTYFNERPSSYIKKYIDPNFVPFWPEPPFPAFPSGHSMNAAAAATVLADLFGDSVFFIDRSHQGFRRYDDVRFLDLTYPARNFTSIWQAANECAYSRFLGGIHTQQDNDVGQQEGIKVGNHVNDLNWKK